MAKKKVRELRVVFDTNVLITESIAALIRAEAGALIRENSKHPDLRIHWYIPQVVLDERTYQMRVKAYECVTHVAKVEKLVQMNFNLTEETLDGHVAKVVQTAIAEYGLRVTPFDPLQVDWNKLIADATFRRPPFEAGKKEKGFRDAIILESFLQLLAASPQTPSICLVAMVTRDTALDEAIKLRTTASANVRVLESVDDVSALINTLISQVDETVISDMRKRAGEYFFLPKDDSTFYFREKLYERIKTAYGSELNSVPKGFDAQELSGITISQPDFQRKVKSRFHWVTRVTLNYKLLNELPMPAPTIPSIGDTSLQSSIASFTGLLGAAAKKKEEVGSVAKVVEVHWSISVDMQKRLSACHLDDMRYVEGSPVPK